MGECQRLGRQFIIVFRIMDSGVKLGSGHNYATLLVRT